MANFAGYTPLTYINGNTPAINEVNLNKNENAIDSLMGEANYSANKSFQQLLKHAYERQTKTIDYCDSYTSFTYTGSYSVSEEWANQLGESGIKISETNNTAGTITMYKTVSLDLTTFYDGSTSNTDDLIILNIYVSDITLTDYVNVILGDDSSNYYYFSTNSLSTGWNALRISKSDFLTTGTPTGWDSITYLRIDWRTLTNASGQYVIYDYLTLHKIDDDYSQGNPWFWNDGNGNFDERTFIDSTTFSIVYFDKRINRLCSFNPWIDFSYNMEVLCTVNSFSLKMEAFTKYTGSGCAMQWYIDYNNWIVVTVTGSTLYIRENVGGTTTSVATVALDSTIEYLDRMVLEVDKTSNNVIHAKLTVDGQRPVYADWETSFDTDEAGCVGITTYSPNQFYCLTDFVVSANQALLQSSLTGQETIYKRKFLAEEVVSSSTLQNDDELWVKLPPMCLYEIVTKLVVNSDDVSNIIIAWDVSGTLTQHSTRAVIGGSVTNDNGDGYQALVRITNHNLTTSVSYGGDSSYGINVQERFTVFTGINGGKLQMQWAQSTSTATPIDISTNSYIIAKRLF